MAAEDLSFTLDSFEGPLDLLLSLISKNKINIYDIPISLIFDQYMEYIVRMQKMDLEVAGEFIDMASRLMLIKSKMLLPKQVVDGKEVDPRTPLVDALLEYRRAKENAKVLGTRFSEFSGRYTKEPDEVGVDRTFVTDHEAALLTKAFERIAMRRRETAMAEGIQSRKNLETILHKKITPVSEKLFFVLRYLLKQGETSFEELMLACESRSDMIASFMAVLQLIRSGRISISREENEDIYLMINRKAYTA